MFSISNSPIQSNDLSQSLSNDKAGALVVFEGWVRNHNQGQRVQSLEYQVYHELALKEGHRILSEAIELYKLHSAKSIHRDGHLTIGDVAIWIGTTASHRDQAFKATRYIIDEMKKRLPIWKKEHYENQSAVWVFCKDHNHHVEFQEADYYKKQSIIVNQEKLKASKVLIIGVGGLGCPTLVSLASAGVGTISFVDFDKIHISNIHRQPLFSPHQVGERKTDVAETRIKELNPFVKVKGTYARVDHNNIEGMITGYDIILDCTDNIETKYLIHDACFRLRIPLISGSVYKNEGQLRTFVPGTDHGCLRCHLSQTPDDTLLGNCNDFGVTGATTSVIGSLQASEAIAYLIHGTNSTARHTTLLDLQTLSSIKIKNLKAKDCHSCQGITTYVGNDLEVTSSDLDQAHLVDIREIPDEELLSHLHKSKRNVLYCHHGVRSKKIARSLRTQGFENVFSLRGGACSL